MGENGYGNRYGNGKGGPAGEEWGRERRQGKQVQAGWAAGGGVKKESVGRGCVVVLGSLQGRC